MIDPSLLRLSKHFLLSDFMGNHSVFTRGYANRFPDDQLRINNGIALCEQALEPIIEKHGALSISYGFIDPELSRNIVTYMDPDKPSHHRWDLGAAADICVHGWVNRNPDDDDVETAPIMLAHDIDQAGIPYSRMISYSESPYLCVAVSDAEIRTGNHRKAFYENRWNNQNGKKPDYRSYSTASARTRAFDSLGAAGLPHGWRGNGFPTYHGGGRRQYHHLRVSKYTMLSDWLMDLQSIAEGVPNRPILSDAKLWDVFCMVGDAYDEILDLTKCARMSIIGGYIAPSNPFFCAANDWRTGTATFSLVPPEGVSCADVRLALLFGPKMNLVSFGTDENVLDITVRL